MQNLTWERIVCSGAMWHGRELNSSAELSFLWCRLMIKRVTFSWRLKWVRLKNMQMINFCDSSCPECYSLWPQDIGYFLFLSPAYALEVYSRCSLDVKPWLWYYQFLVLCWLPVTEGEFVSCCFSVCTCTHVNITWRVLSPVRKDEEIQKSSSPWWWH